MTWRTRETKEYEGQPRQGRVIAAACCGLAGCAFLTAGWLTAGELTPHYSAIHQTISELARSGEPQHLLMTSAFIAFSLATVAFGSVFGKSLGHPRYLSLSVLFIGLATLGIAAFPLSARGGTAEDVVHELFAAAAYSGGACAPMIAGRALRQRGSSTAGKISLAVGASVAALSVTLFSSYAGLFQRLGVTVVVCWIAAMSILLMRGALAGERAYTSSVSNNMSAEFAGVSRGKPSWIQGLRQ
jgi:Protein of unknown function (DUF998)